MKNISILLLLAALVASFFGIKATISAKNVTIKDLSDKTSAYEKEIMDLNNEFDRFREQKERDDEFIAEYQTTRDAENLRHQKIYSGIQNDISIHEDKCINVHIPVDIAESLRMFSATEAPSNNAHKD